MLTDRSSFRPAGRRARHALAGATGLALLLVAVLPSPVSARTRPYLLGDSVVAWSEAAIEQRLGHTGLVIDALACRGAVASCVVPGQGTRPPSGLSTIKAQRGRLGDLVVIELGYNDRPQRRAIELHFGEHFLLPDRWRRRQGGESIDQCPQLCDVPAPR